MVQILRMVEGTKEVLVRLMPAVEGNLVDRPEPWENNRVVDTWVVADMVNYPIEQSSVNNEEINN